MNSLEEKIGYAFRDAALLREALTHSSCANESAEKTGSNERLEFLGDSVLSAVVSEYLFSRFSALPEGDLTKMRAALVCEESLYGFAKDIGLGERLFLGRGESLSGGAFRPSILADAFEALIAAVYIDGGYDEAKSFILRFIEPAVISKRPRMDGKTALQEIAQKKELDIRYVLVSAEGPDHRKTFVSEVWLGGVRMGAGTGQNRKASEQDAAKNTLELMGFAHG